MLKEARKYFRTYSEKQRVVVKKIIHNLRLQERKADQLEDGIRSNAFHLETDPVTVFHVVRLADYFGSIADHAENTGDMMRAMIAQ